tara:strand:- start:102 stop:521 length:420 start_codon:yes stop_codon:yes gene_type:complete
MWEYGRFAATETAPAPAAYYVLPEAADIIERLEAHGVVVVRYSAEREVSVQAFRVDSTTVAPREFQGRRERTVFGAWADATVRTLPEGTAYVSVDQPLGRLAFTLLEPRSDDGFVAWALLDDALEAGALPVLRGPAPPG